MAEGQGKGTSQEGVARGALSRIRVIDLSQVAAGPYLSSLLGDLGADVIKVEPPEGEAFRFIDNDFGPGESSYFFGINRSKRAVTLDLKDPAGALALRKLVATADVFIVSMRPATLPRLGIDYDTLRALNPRLIYCEISGFGSSGPRADEPGMDILAQAVGGLMGITGEPGRPPVKVGAPVADFATSFVGGFAICAALHARERDGVGQHISLNLLDCTVALLANYGTSYFKTGRPIRPVGGGHPQLVPYQVFAAADGHIVVGCLNDRFWPPLCEALGLPELASDPRYRRNADRVRNRDELVALLAGVFVKEPRQTWIERLRGHDVPCSPVNAFEEVFEDPQVRHNEMLVTLEHPVFGSYRTIANPIRMSATPPRPHGHSPGLGEHNAEVLGELEP